MNLVQRTITPVQGAALDAALAQAYYDVAGAQPGADVLAFGRGIVGIETDGGRLMHNFNFGNIMAGHGWSGDAWARSHADAGQPQAFRAYPTALDGARGFWRLLTGRYVSALEALPDQGAAWSRFFELGYFVPTSTIDKSAAQQLLEYRAGAERWARIEPVLPAPALQVPGEVGAGIALVLFVGGVAYTIWKVSRL